MGAPLDGGQVARCSFTPIMNERTGPAPRILDVWGTTCLCRCVVAVVAVEGVEWPEAISLGGVVGVVVMIGLVGVVDVAIVMSAVGVLDLVSWLSMQ